MNKFTVIIVFILFILYILWISSTDYSNCNQNDNIEGYYNYCGKCHDKTFSNCLKCANCGFISKNGSNPIGQTLTHLVQRIQFFVGRRSDSSFWI